MSNPIEQSIAILEEGIEKNKIQIIEWQKEIDRLEGKSNPLPSELREKQDILQHAVDALVGVSLDLGKQAKVMTLTDVHTPQAIPDNVKLDMALKPYKDRVMQLFEQEYQRRSNEMLDRLEGKSYGIKQYIEVSQYPARWEPERVPATNKVISLSDVQAERTNLKQLSEGDNYARSK